MYVLQNGEDLSLGSGFAAVETQRPMSASRIYRVGAVTKSYVATTVFQLVEEERLALTDTVEQRLPGVLPYGSRVTVRQLLQHRSGVPDYLAVAPLGDYLTGGPGALRVWKPQDLVGLVSAQPPAFDPGSAWGYSNTNYVLLGLIVERVTRRSLAAEVDRRIMRPLALDDTTFLVGEEDPPNPRARGYAAPRGPDGQPTTGLPTVVPGFDPSIAWAAGNMTSDVEDVADFYAFLLGGRFLSDGLLTEMKAGVPTTVTGMLYGGGLRDPRTALRHGLWPRRRHLRLRQRRGEQRGRHPPGRPRHQPFPGDPRGRGGGGPRRGRRVLPRRARHQRRAAAPADALARAKRCLAHGRSGARRRAALAATADEREHPQCRRHDPEAQEHSAEVPDPSEGQGHELGEPVAHGE